HSNRFRKLRCPPAQMQRRPPTCLTPYLELLPRHSPAAPDAKRLSAGFFSGKSRRKALCRVLFSLAVGNFAYGEDPLQKPVAKPGDTLLNPLGLDQIRP